MAILRRPLLLAIATLILGMGSSRGTTFLELQSTYLGNGWFQYQMNVMDDPFFKEADITGLIIHFRDQVASNSLSQNWINSSYTNTSDGGFSDWEFNSAFPLRPNTETFLLQSSLTSFRTGAISPTNGAMVLSSLYLNDIYPGVGSGPIYSQNLVGFAEMPCLVPCTPAEADGSPTNLVYDLKLVPDVNINQLMVDSSGVHGVDFDWSSEATFVLQGTSDLNNWTNITYIYSTPPETTWTTNQNLGAYGQFFRVELAADGYVTNLPPAVGNVQLAKAIATTKSVSATTLPYVTSFKPAAGQIAVNIATETNQVCTVQALDSHQTIVQTRQVFAAGNAATVSFDSSTLPNPVFFQVLAAK